jgi:hypothetical protein|nr:MAG TPA: hypothetical protein [Caudoviricetes sp.]
MSPVSRAATLIEYRTHVRIANLLYHLMRARSIKKFHFLEIVEHENSGGTPAKMTPTA